MISKPLMFGLLATLVVAGTAAAASNMPSDFALRGKHFGRFVVEDDNVAGKYVSFGVADGTIVDYTVKRQNASRVVFESIDLGAAYGEPHVRGPIYGARAESYGLVAFDARNAAMWIHARNATTITLTVADGISAAKHEAEPGWSPEGVLLTDEEGRTGRLVLRGDANATVDGQTIVVELGQGGTMAFRLDGHPRELLAEKIALHKIAKNVREEGRSGLGDRSGR